MINSDGANETDVREEIAAPLLSALGYSRGTKNDILREFSLSYNKNFLGRKKANDPPLRGRADYILSVTGAGRWVLEIKSPAEEISHDVIDQAISYARHPEISATYSAILNGVRFVLFHSSQSSHEDPLVDLEVSSPSVLASQVESLLSPSAIRRDCSPPIVDLNKPLAEGFRSSANVIGGAIRHAEFLWNCNINLALVQAAPLDEMCRRMRGYRAAITGGNVWRDEFSRIRAKLEWSAPHDEVLRLINDKQLMGFQYVCLNDKISDSNNQPTFFDVVGSIELSAGETVFDVMKWENQLVGIDTFVNYRCQAIGHIEEAKFKGKFQAEYECRFSSMPLDISFYTTGDFEVLLLAR
jgi:hypothetical protein